MASSKLVLVRIFSNETDALVAKGHLEANGVRAFISKDDAGGMYSAFQVLHGVRLMVFSEDEHDAREILTAMNV
jgi:hypothetical protein